MNLKSGTPLCAPHVEFHKSLAIICRFMPDMYKDATKACCLAEPQLLNFSLLGNSLDSELLCLTVQRNMRKNELNPPKVNIQLSNSDCIMTQKFVSAEFNYLFHMSRNSFSKFLKILTKNRLSKSVRMSHFSENFYASNINFRRYFLCFQQSLG